MELTDLVSQRTRFIDAMLSETQGAWPDLEELVSATYTAWVRPGDTVFDIGVNHGTHTLQLAKLVGPHGHVVGVEAVPAFAAHTRELLVRDELARRVTLHECAVAAEAGSADFFVTSITDGGLSGLRLRPVIATEAFERITVEKKTLDALMPDQPVRFAKLDVEGGEYDALRGARALLAQKPLIAFEFNESAPSEFGYGDDDLRDLLLGAGYRVFDIFGFEADSGAAMTGARVWNFLAIPDGVDPLAVTAPARRVLEAKIPKLAALRPIAPPAPEPVAREQDAGEGTRLLIPGLAPFYAWAEPAFYALLRVAFGLILLTHGIPKTMGEGHGGASNAFARAVGRMQNDLHLPFAEGFAAIVAFLETGGALMLAAGLLTRLVAPMIAVEMALICVVLAPVGWVWSSGGMEYALLMGFLALFISIRGGGRYSIDRLIGREL